jgi:hypothetical protein
MPTYYFHVRSGSELIRDQEGQELASLEDARAEALGSARDLLAEGARVGADRSAWAVLVADEAGGTLAEVPLSLAADRRD